MVKDNISDDNNTWLYYEYQHPAPLNWPWRAFVLKNRDQIPYEPVLNQQYSITINIKALMDSITDAPLDGNWYIPGIELGNENAGSNGSTSGGIEINQYCLNINGNQTCTNSTPPSPSATPTSMYVTPTIYCLGSCPTLPITPTTTESPSNQPFPSQSPVPSEAVTPTTEVTPIASPSPTQIPIPGKRKNIFEIIRDMILKIIQSILQVILQLLNMFSFK